MTSERNTDVTTRARDVEDIFVAALPPPMAMDWRLGGRHRDEVMAWLEYHARMKVMAQWDNRYPVPKSVEISAIDFTLTDSVHDAALFQPAHDCQDCRDGVQKAVDYLKAEEAKREDEDEPTNGLDKTVIAFANIKYKETWV
jgi:hypothetical protein